MDLPVDYRVLSSAKRKLAREQYVRMQKGLCCHCGEPLDGKPAESVRQQRVDRRLFPPNFFKWLVHLHHHHDTGMTIGAVHCYCNAVLWQHHGE